jgi:hypothetical protein
MMLTIITIFFFYRLESFFKPVANPSVPIKRKVCLHFYVNKIRSQFFSLDITFGVPLKIKFFLYLNLHIMM